MTMMTPTSGASISAYIAQCANKGKEKVEDIIAEAKKDINEIEATLHQQQLVAAKLRPRKTILLQVLKTFGEDFSKNKPIPKTIPDKTTTETFETLDPEQQEWIKKVCSFLEEKYFSLNKKATPSEIMEGLGVSLENDYIIYNVIRWLGTEEIISRSEGALIILGKNWNFRPRLKDIMSF